MSTPITQSDCKDCKTELIRIIEQMRSETNLKLEAIRNEMNIQLAAIKANQENQANIFKWVVTPLIVILGGIVGIKFLVPT